MFFKHPEVLTTRAAAFTPRHVMLQSLAEINARPNVITKSAAECFHAFRLFC